MAIINCIKFTLMTLLIIFVFISVSFAEIRSTEIRNGSRHIIPFEEFVFTHTGRLELNVSQISFTVTIPDQEFKKLGFFLCTRDAWLHVLQQIDDRDISCALDSEFVSSVFTFNNINIVDESFQTVYVMSNPDQYTLMFANCIKDLKVSMNVKAAMYNLKGKNGDREYLSAGKTVLPTFYFMFSLIYFALGCLWVHTLYKKRLTVSGVHFVMLTVVIINALDLLCEAENMRYIKKTGTAHRWAVLLYIFSFLQRIMLFPLVTLIILIHVYLSFSIPYMQDIEKTVLMIARKGILSQIFANIAEALSDKIGPFGRDPVDCKQTILLLLEVFSCCGVLIPIVWSTKKFLERTRAHEIYLNLRYLTTNFRYRYIVVTGYIYFTRAVVYVLETNTSYNYHWTSVVVAELAKLVFYDFLLRLLVPDN